MSEGDSGDMCSRKLPLMLTEGGAEGLASTDPRARTPISVSVISPYCFHISESTTQILMQYNDLFGISTLIQFNYNAKFVKV